MPTKRSKKQKQLKNLVSNNDNLSNPKNAKLVLFVFGIGPLIAIGVFLALNGFFS